MAKKPKVLNVRRSLKAVAAHMESLGFPQVVREGKRNVKFAKKSK